jgi:hypothetical protein
MAPQRSNSVIIVALIGAVASVVTAIVSSKTFVHADVQEQVDNLAVSSSDEWQEKSPNVPFSAEQGGFVVALVSANPSHRSVQAQGIVGGNLVAVTSSQDSTVPGVPSINQTSFMMPVPKGETWEVKVASGDESQVKIKWFAISHALSSK